MNCDDSSSFRIRQTICKDYLLFHHAESSPELYFRRRPFICQLVVEVVVGMAKEVKNKIKEFVTIAALIRS